MNLKTVGLEVHVGYFGEYRYVRNFGTGVLSVEYWGPKMDPEARSIHYHVYYCTLCRILFCAGTPVLYWNSIFEHCFVLELYFTIFCFSAQTTRAKPSNPHSLNPSTPGP